MIPSVISAMRFSVWSPAEIRRYSAVEVTEGQTYDRAADRRGGAG